MFPPASKKPAGPPSPGPGGPPDPFGGGGNPFGPCPARPPADPSGTDPFGGSAILMTGPPPGMPKPGQGMDPMQAMLNGLGPDPLSAGPVPPQGAPLGPGGLPLGGSLPQPGQEGGDDMEGSGLLQALTRALGGRGSDPYGVAPLQPGQAFQGMGTGDPSMGVERLLQLLALGRMGVGGEPGAGSSGVDVSLFGGMAQIAGG